MTKILLFLYILITFPICLSAQIITTIAGTGVHGFTGDGEFATDAEIFAPEGIAVDTSGNIYFGDCWNQRIRKIDRSGIITTIAGNGAGWFSGDGGPATNASLYYPIAICIDATNNIYISDCNNNRIRKINPTGTITTIAGNGTFGFSGDGGPATLAQLRLPSRFCIDSSGNIYFGDVANQRIRKVDHNGNIFTVAGNGTAGYSGDGSAATNAALNRPTSACLDNNGNLYIADQGNSRIRKVSSSGIITTIAGTGMQGYTGDGGPATAAKIFGPAGLFVDHSGNLLFSDFDNFVIRKIDIAGIISTVVGIGIDGYSGDGGNATAAQLNYATDVCIDQSGDLLITDRDNHRIRKISYSKLATPSVLAVQSAITVYPNPATETLYFRFPLGDVVIKLTDLAGRLMSEQVVQQGSRAAINVSGYAPGIYIYQVTTAGKTTTGKVVVER